MLMERLVELMHEHGLRNFWERKIPTTNLPQLLLYFGVPAVKARAIEYERTTPFQRKFWSKRFWTNKASRNPFTKKFWSYYKKISEKDVELTGINRVKAQIVNTDAVWKKVDKQLPKMRIPHGKHIDVRPVPITGEWDVVQPLVIAFSPKNEQGKQFINKLKKALEAKDVPHLDRIAQLESVAFDVSSGEYRMDIIDRTQKPPPKE